MSALFLCEAAQAAVPDSIRANDVASRPRPGLDPIGLTLGAFRVFPMLDAGVSYDDNVYNSDDLKRHSSVFTLQPNMAVRSDWSRHSLSLDASGDFRRYGNLERENSDAYAVTAEGRLDIVRDVAVMLDGRYSRAIEPRGSAGDIVIGGEPLVYRTYGGTAMAMASRGVLQLMASGSLDRFSYRDIRVGSERIDQGYRNRRATAAQLQIGYAVGPSLVAFAEGRYVRERYGDSRSTNDGATSGGQLPGGDPGADISGATLDSHGYSLFGGARFAVSRLVSGSVAAGYTKRRYRDPRFAATGALTYEASVFWNPTTLVTVTLRANRAIDESPLPGISGVMRDRLSAMADYELLRRLIVTATASYDNEKYRGISRRDRRLGGAVEARYLVNRIVEAGVRLDHARQSGSGLEGRDYRSTRVGLFLRIQR